MIEEIDSATYNRHYLEKVFAEVGSDPRAFLAAALDFLAQQTPFFQQPGAADTVAQLARQHLPAAAAGATAAAGASPATAAVAVAAPPVAQAPLPADEPAQAAAAAPAAQLQAEGAQPEGADAAAGDGEDEQQAAAEPSSLKPNSGNGADLPTYSWTQTLSEVVVCVPVPPGTKGRDCAVTITRDKLRMGLKGQPPVLDSPLFAAVKPDDCLWSVVDGRQLEVTLAKRGDMQWWRAVVVGQPEIDVQAVEPEASKLTDLDPEMRATVEKMMYDQRQKALGLPTSEEQHKANIMQQFMAAHPEMDFSNAKIQL